MKFIGSILLLCGFVALQGCCAAALFHHKEMSSWERSRDKQARELSRIAETTITDNGILVKLKNDILFETGKAELGHKADKQVQSLADVLMKYPGNWITIVGHTDNVGTPEDNLTLSRNRAQSVKNGLVNDGVAPKDVSTVGKGETEPLVPNDSDGNRATNRRAELRIRTVE